MSSTDEGRRATGRPLAHGPAGRYLLGCLLVLAAGATMSLGAFCVRLAPDADAWQYTLWRSVAFALALWAISSARDRRRSPLRQIADLKPIAWAGAFFMTLSATMFIAAVMVTTLAETFFLCSLSPLLSAAAARPLLGERISRWGLAAIALGLAGVLIMIEGRLDGGNWTGRLLAILSAIGFSGFTLCTRGSSGHDRDALLLAFGFLSLAVGVGATLLNGRPLLPPLQDTVAALVHGGIILAAGLLLYAQGSRHVPAITMIVLAQAEAILAPLWGYLFFAERSSMATLAGGAVILTAVVLQAATGERTGGHRRA